MRRIASGFMLALLLTGSLTFVFNIQLIRASGTIYIRADGNVDPPTANIASMDYVTYYFTDNNYDAIVVEKSNIIIDGKGYTLQGPGALHLPYGISLSGRNNVTIKNLKISQFSHGISVWNSSKYNSVSGNTITNNDYGILIGDSSNNIINGNTITNNDYGVRLAWSSYNVISGNNITANNKYGIYLLDFSEYNSVSGNTITNNEHGISILRSSNNTLRNNDVSKNKYNLGVNGFAKFSHYIHDIDSSNTVDGKPVYYLIDRRDMTLPLDAGYAALVNCTRITVQNLKLCNNEQGVLLVFTTNSTITRNNITNNSEGVRIHQCSNFNISENNIENNDYYGIYSSKFLEEPSNYNNISGNNVENNGNGIDLMASSNNSISGNNVTNNVSGIRITGNYNIVSGNNIAYNGYGIWIIGKYSVVSGNNIAYNGIGIRAYRSHNSIYHNSFVNNSDQVFAKESFDAWDNDYPSGGNYWSDYEGRYPEAQELDDSGIWDTPYYIDETNQDNYPLIDPWRDDEIPRVDLNSDGFVDIKDITIVALAFGSFPDHPRWNPKADLNQDDRIDIKDVIIIARNFGKTYL